MNNPDPYLWLDHQNAAGQLMLFWFSPGGLAFWLLLLTALFSLLVSSLASVAESSMLSLSHLEAETIREDKGSTFQTIRKLISAPRHLSAVLFTMRSLGQILFVSISVFLFFDCVHEGRFILPGLFLVILLLFTVVLIFAEWLPRRFAESDKLNAARTVCNFVYGGSRLLNPLIVTFLRKEKNSAGETIKEEDKTEEPEAVSESNIYKGLIKFSSIHVKQVMRPRMDIVFVDMEMPYDEVIKIVKESGYSRLPVSMENLDQIKGILYTKDLLEFLEQDKPTYWQSLIRPAFFTPEGKKISELLIEFQSKRIHLAIVIDEYGRTAGIISLEDLIEEILGDIRDESDDQPDFEFARISEDHYVFEGKTLLNDVCRALKISASTFDEVREDSDTLAGLILELLGRMPQYREQVSYGEFTFTVLNMDNQRIRRVKVERNKSEVSDK